MENCDLSWISANIIPQFVQIYANYSSGSAWPR